VSRSLYDDQFPTFGHFLQAVASAGLGAPPDPRLLVGAAAGLGGKVPSEGGFLLPEEFAAALWDRAWTQGELLQRCARQPVTRGDSVTIPAVDETSRADGSRLGGLRVYWSDEADTVAPSKAKYAAIRLQPNKLLGLSWVTEELAQDAPALGAWLERAFGLEASFVVENEVINGSGSGRPLGILNSGAAIEVAAEAGQAAGTVVVENVRGMARRLWIGSRRAAVWLCSPDLEPELETLELPNGAPAFFYGADGEPRLLGRPVVATEYNPPPGSRGDLVLADLGQYLIAERERDLISSVHVHFLEHERAFRFRWRIDGQPAWAGPVAPKNSALTQSPFVVLAARP
jgi:HK97 family phage major capsid protein